MVFEFIQVKTRVVKPPRDEIWDILDGIVPVDGDIIFIASKILAIHQGRCVAAKDADKTELIKREAERVLPAVHACGFKYHLTVTGNVLIPDAGIDESNADGHYILWPKDTDKLCAEIRARFINKYSLKKLGIVATDGHVTPLRTGVTGITTGLAGFNPLKDMRGGTDIFGRKMGVTQVNLIDPLTAVAVLLMGEAAEQTPVVILRGYGGIPFCDGGSMKAFKIPPESDLYGPLIDMMKKQQ